ncbi:MAG: lysophospholipid acyltransferase family protein [Algisphaera sp.]
MGQRGPIYEKFEYVAARLLSAGVTSFSPRANQMTARKIGELFDRFDAKHRNRAQYHIRLCFPEWTDAQVAECARESTRNLMQLAFEILQTPQLLNRDSWRDHIKTRNLGASIDVLNSDGPRILLTAHLGNWEVLGYFLAMIGYHTDTIARPLDNVLINDWLMGIREKQGMRMVTKFDATDRMTSVLENDGLLAFTADQNAGSKGVFVPFFGRLASTYKSIGLLAMTYNTPIVCGYGHRLPGAFQFEVGTTDVILPEEWADQPDPLYYITARYSRAFERMVRLRPEQALWTHRRWKSRPRHELLGKPLPKALRRNLEALPWMDDATMQKIENPPPLDPVEMKPAWSQRKERQRAKAAARAKTA